MKSPWISVGPKFNDKCRYKRERERQRRRACEDGGKDGSYVHEVRESLGHPEWEQVKKDSPQAIRGKMGLRTRRFQTSGFRKHCEKYIPLALHLPISY